MNGKTIKLGNDIALNNTAGWENWATSNSGLSRWTPIGAKTANPFRGTFDGDGYTVSGVYFKTNFDATDDYGNYRAGLFGVNSGTIKNLGVIASYIKGGYNYAGGLVGLNGGTISNSYATGSVEGKNSGDQVGGLAGANSGTIIGCYTTGNVSGKDQVGGLAGANSGTISNSYATGNVSATYNAGGFVGLNGGTISNSYTTGNVNGDGTVGGFVGDNGIPHSDGGTISNSYATGNVKGGRTAGGFVGTEGGTITNSYYDRDNSGATYGSGTGLTTNEMKNISIYAIGNWDLGSIWAIDSFTNNGYPFLLPPSYAQGKNPITASKFYLSNQRQKNDTIPTTIEFHTGNPIEPQVDSVILNSIKLKGTDYDVLYYNNTAIDTAKIIILGKGNYYGAKVLDFYITDFRDINDASVAPILDQLATGSPIRYKPVVKDYNDEVTLREGIDYLLGYSNITSPGTATIEIVGSGVYDGTSRIVTFEIVGAKQLQEKTTSKIIDSTRYVYSGSKITPEITVSYTPETITLVKDRDYTVSYGENTNAGTGTIYINGIGNYTGTVTKEFPIAPKALATSMADPVSPQQYTGTAIEPEITLTDGERTLTLGTDYTVRYLSNDYPTNEAMIRITGTGNYTGTITILFTITEDEIIKTNVAVVWQGPFTFEYNGQNRCPAATATLPSGAPIALSIRCTAVNARPEEPYTATATYPNALYELLNKTASFTISRAPITATLEIPNIIQGTALSPSVKGTKENGAINYWYSKSRNTGYTPTAPTAEGVYHAYAIVSPTNNYNGSTTDTVSFSIYKSDPSPIQVTWSEPYSFVYTGTEQSPGASASLGGTPFPLIVKGATEAGTHTAAARFQTERTDYKLANAAKEFTITPKPLPEEAIDPIGNFFYTGFQIRPPSITVKDGSKELAEGIDYTISYGENVSQYGTVTASGIGNYGGTASRQFPISSEGAAIVSVVWGTERTFAYDGAEHAPAATASNLELEIIGRQSNAGSHTAVAQLKTANPSIMLANSSMPYTISKKPLTVTWEKEEKYVYSKMTQGPTPSVEESGVTLRVSNTYSGVGEYTAANKRAPYAVIISANANNYELLNNSVDYAILPKPLNPYFTPVLPPSDFNPRTDALWVPYEVFKDSAALLNALSTLIDYDGFATDTLSKESDNASVLRGSPKVTLQYTETSPSTLSKRVETSQRATATIVTDDMSADNYALTRPAIVILATIEEDDTAAKIYCQLGNACAMFSEAVCSAISGLAVEKCDVKVACVINSVCVENTPVEECTSIGGDAYSSCYQVPALRPQLSGGTFRMWQTASGVVNVDLGYMPATPVKLQIYDLKGNLIATEQVNTRFANVKVGVPSGVYLFKVGKDRVLKAAVL